MKNRMVDLFCWNNAANPSFINVFQKGRAIPQNSIVLFSQIVNEYPIWPNRVCAADDPTVPGLRMGLSCPSTDYFSLRNRLD